MERQPQTIEEVIKDLKERIDKLQVEIKCKEEMHIALYLYLTYLENINANGGNNGNI